jgi:hypothetical protein
VWLLVHGAAEPVPAELEVDRVAVPGGDRPDRVPELVAACEGPAADEESRTA